MHVAFSEAKRCKGGKAAPGNCTKCVSENMKMKSHEVSHTDVSINISELWEEFPIERLAAMSFSRKRSIFDRIYRLRILPFAIRQKVWFLLNRSFIDTTWLDQLNDYWTVVLGGRPILGPLDFAFLHGLYRRKFYQYSKNINYKSDTHLSIWQRPELLYQLINLSYQESTILGLYKALMVKNALAYSTVLEFGAAIGPITRAMMRFGLANRRIYIADLPTYAFHYACYRYSSFNNIIPIILRPENNFDLPDNIELGAIYCIEVFEHLPDPMATVAMFYDRLIKGGVLIFDYIKSNAHGLDTKAGLEARPDVLQYIKSRFVVVHGSLNNIDETIGLTIVRKN